MLIFLGSFIPLVGLLVTGAFAVAIALSRSVELHPLAVVLAVVVGTTLGGIAGKLIAVPLAAFLNTTIRALRAGPGAASRKDLPIDEPPSRASQGG